LLGGYNPSTWQLMVHPRGEGGLSTGSEKGGKKKKKGKKGGGPAFSPVSFPGGV